MENIEETIKLLKNIIKINNNFFNSEKNKTLNQKEISAIEHILFEYKKHKERNEILLKTNEILSKENAKYKKSVENISREYLNVSKQLSTEIKENYKLKNQTENCYFDKNELKERIAKYKKIRDDLYTDFIGNGRKDKKLHDYGIWYEAKINELEKLIKNKNYDK